MTWGCEWRHAPEARSVDFGDFEKSQLSWVLQSEEEGWLSLAHSGLVAGASRVGGADGKANIERLCLSLYVEKPLNSKVIKSFVPELRSRKCFWFFGIPMFYVYMLRTFYVRFAYPYHGYCTNKFVCWRIQRKTVPYTLNVWLYHYTAQIVACKTTVFKWKSERSQWTFLLHLRLKCQSDVLITSPWEKMTNTQKPRLGSLIPKFIRYYTF